MRKKKIMKRKKGINDIAFVNRIIDQTFHPYFHKDKNFIILDTALHFMVEGNPKQSVKKFLRYSLKYFI